MRMQILHTIYWKVYSEIWRIYATIAPVSATKRRYKNSMGRFPDLSNPKSLNEKMQYLKLFTYRHNPVVIQCTDKYAVRQYVKDRGCEEILNDLYYVYDSVDEIDWNQLPNEFVLKCNHGSGGNIVCHDKSKLDINDAKKKLYKWMKDDFGLERVEFSYEGIDRKIICEKYIETEDGLPPNDYKFFCSYGEPKLLYVASDRYDDNTKIDYYTPDWEWIDVRNARPNAGPKPKPELLDEMMEYAKKLSRDFPLVRVDLYCEFGKVIFGELTFLHFGGVTPFEPYEMDRVFGELFPIENKA